MVELKKNGYSVKYTKDKKLEIGWKEGQRKQDISNKEIQDLIKKVFNKPDEYFEHKPIYWWRGEFPKQFFL